MKKGILGLIIGLFISIFLVNALEVAVEEIYRTRNANIQFVNFTGPVTVNESASQIRAIGQGLALASSATPNQLHTINNRYSIIEVSDDINDGLFSAAILFIDPQARVDHIRNVRQIVAGFLQARYDYSFEDANVLAYFLSFYNAVYRGDVAFLQTVYKPAVFNYVTAQNAGISRFWNEWAGNTAFIIPLVDASTMAISVLGSEVTAAARNEEADMAIDMREALQEIRADAIDQNEAAITANEEQIAQNQEQLPQLQQQAEQAGQQADQAQQQANQTQEQANQAQQAADQAQQAADEALAAGDPNAAQLQEQANQAQQAANQAQQTADEAQEQAEEAQQQAEEAQQAADQTQQQTEQLQNQNEQLATENQQIAQQIQQEQQQLAVDQATQQAIADPATTAQTLVDTQQQLAQAQQQLDGISPMVGGIFYFMDVSERFLNGHYRNRLLAINPVAGEIMATSSLEICSRQFLAFSGGVVSITAMDVNHASGHNLTMFDLQTLQPIHNSEGQNIYWNSFIVNDAGNILAVTVVGNNFFLGRFDQQLNLTATSVAQLDADTTITVYGNFIYATYTGRGQIVIMDRTTLATVSTINISR
ncbi:MAG: hypothetical protein FWE37_01110 [Spirochaetaceae bacterium]|nr:hypothetical protein [Spirochaetaceae bacterium]